MSGPDDQREWVLTALDQFERRLLRYAARLLDDEHAARDAVQHTFLRLCHTSPDKVGDRLAAWLYTVCRNRSLDLLRTARRDHSKSGATEQRGAPLRSAGECRDPAALAEQKELHGILRQAVAELPEGQREAVWLYAEGFTYREIAAITECTEGSVRVAAHRAFVRLRAHPQLQNLFAEQDKGIARSRVAVPDEDTSVPLKDCSSTRTDDCRPGWPR